MPAQVPGDDRLPADDSAYPPEPVPPETVPAEPAVRAEPVAPVAAEPTIVAEPAVMPEPVVVPVGVGEPVGVAERAVVAEPAVVGEPVGVAEPAVVGEPVGVAEPAVVGEPVVPEPVLPEAVRQRVISLAAAALTGLPGDELPLPLRRMAKFAPNRRARLAGAPIATQLSGDPLFRQRVAGRVLDEAGELGAAVLEGTCPAAADPVEVAALAYLSRPPGWVEMVEAAGQVVRAEAESAAVTEQLRDAEQRSARAEHDRAVARVEADKLRDELARLREEAAGLREENRTLSRSVRELQGREKRANELVATEKGRLHRALSDHDAELRRLRARLAEAETTAGANRQNAKEARQVDDARLWLLLETIGQAAVGLRRELALEPSSLLPADVVAAETAGRPGAGQGQARALEADDPARLDRLLALPKAHLIVDGYNVTKTGFPDISLEQQRSRLVNGLGGLAAQTRAEVTAVFDGAERIAGLPPAPRGVRVLFSRKGETADELIRRLVRAEPAGRPIIVISSDKEVADGVRRHGAYPLGSSTLLRRLARV